MVYAVYDRVKQKCSVIGDTDPITLGASILGYKRFSDVLNDGDTFHYMVVNITNAEWEAGLGTYNQLGQTITRQVASSSNSDTYVVFTDGEKEVFISALSENLVVKDPITSQLSVNHISANLSIDGSGKITLLDTVTLAGNIKDSTGSTGTTGQVLTQTTTGVAWQNSVGGSSLIKTFNIIGTFGLLVGTAKFFPIQNDTIRSVTLNVDSPGAQDLMVGLYRNNVFVSFFTITAGQYTSKYSGLNILIQPGEFYTVSVVAGTAKNFSMGLYNVNL